ncbi:MAG: hypothetical protein Unbinned15contig1001_17 [Prokaryotic dsDNA virus sp.]|nr:MAG: hypothetical protein Unbinned15contig1001_17 [Prokaryotic dsDNA virus sp.]|tara:strand:- start:20108 stop:20710 length:603 start_codon:yes stop_codon:yes gene_type:complete
MKEAHAFIVRDAVEYGLDKAILLQHIRFWINQNDGKKTHTHDNKVWMYQSASDMTKHYPYWSRQKISRLLREMEDDGLIVSGNFNKLGYDQTKWYTIQCSELNNRSFEIEQPIPYTKQDTKTDILFDECWAMYGKKGNKKTAIRYWKKYSEEDKLSIQSKIIPYISSREYKYRKDFQGWINPIYRMWEDQIEEKEKRISI